MVEMECLAHRGLWKQPREKNSRRAFERAFQGGFGVETDLRDHDGTVVISHDPPGGIGTVELTFEEFLSLRDDLKANGTLALNVKADGLSTEIDRLLREYGVTNYFVFDMSVPDMLSYLKLGMNCFSRQSEFETPLKFRKDACDANTVGIWLDSFGPIWYSPALIQTHLASGLDVCLVSPELHRRDPVPWWNELKRFIDTTSADGSRPWGALMLCTDHPDRI